MIKAGAYKAGRKIPLGDIANPGSAILEVELGDHRTVQLVVREDGTVSLRGWGNKPMKMGNSTQMEFSAVLQKQGPVFCEGCFNPLERCECE